MVGLAGLLGLAGPAAALPGDPVRVSNLVSTASTSAGRPFDHKAVLRDVDTRANAVGARITAAEAKVAALRTEVVKASRAPTRALLVHREEVNPSFRLESVTYTLDGVPVLERGPERLKAVPVQELEILSGEITPGAHQLRASLIYVGTGEGTYARVREYRFVVEKSHDFTAIEGRLAKVVFTTITRPEARLEVKDRLAVRATTEIMALTQPKPKAPEPAPAP